MKTTKIFKNEKYTKFVYISMLVILFLFIPDLRSEVNINSITTSLVFFFVAVTIHLISQKDKNWFRLDILFLLGFSVVHFQWAIMVAFSDMDLSDIRYIKFGITDLRYMNYGTWLSTVGILDWFLGYSFFTRKKKGHVIFKIKYKKLLWLAVVLFLLFIIMAGNNFLSGGVYKGHGGSATGEGISVYFQLLFSISILVLTIVIIINSKNNQNIKILTWVRNLDKKYLTLVGIYLLLFLSIGDRGAGMQVTFTFLVVFGAIVKPISFKQFSAIIIIGAILLTLIGLGRSSDSGKNILVAGADKIEFKSNYDITLELANSARTLYSALEHIPEKHDYFGGKLWLGRILALMPFSQNIYLQLSNDKLYEMGSPAYLTYLRFGLNPPSGEGTSLIADIYLNFGLLGVLFLMFVLGIFMKKLQNELNIQKNFYWIIVAGIFANVAFYMGRGGLLDGLRYIIWGLILVIIFVKKRKIKL